MEGLPRRICHSSIAAGGGRERDDEGDGCRVDVLEEVDDLLCPVAFFMNADLGVDVFDERRLVDGAQTRRLAVAEDDEVP